MGVFNPPLDTKWRYGFAYTSTLGEATISTSTWAADPATGIALTGSSHDDTSSSVLAEISAAGTYRITNSIVADDGTEDAQSHILVAEDSSDFSYLGPTEAQLRLAAYGIDGTPSQGDLIAASAELEGMSPFIGTRLDEGQTLSFPRSLNPDLTTNEETDVPPAVLDWVALAAHTIASPDAPAVMSESIGSTSRTYSTPRVSQSSRRMAYLIEPYLLKVGQRVGAYDTWRTHESYPDWPLG